MCKAVTALHLRNVCHRDIAMRNLLLSDDKKHVLLSDFSLSRVVSSAIKSQTTFTSFLPRESAPETRGKDNSSTDQRHYSLKSDVWNMGITMYGIVEKGLSAGKKWHQPPGRFSSKHLPSNDLFNRKDDLWRAMRRCWDPSPEERPQSWELQQWIGDLLENPLNLDNENEAYITRFSASGTTNMESTWDDQIVSNSNSHYPGESYRNYEVIDELQSSCTSLNVQSAVSSTFSEQEDLYSLKKITGPGSRMNFLSPVRGSKKKSQGIKRSTLWEQDSPERLVGARPKLHPIIDTSGSVILQNSRNILLVTKNKSDTASPNTHLRVRWGVKFMKRLGSLPSVVNSSLSSMFNASTNSVEDAHFMSEKDEYCSPLSFSYKSTATNIAYCSERRFFSKSSCKLIGLEKTDSPEYFHSPKLEPVNENSSSCKVVQRNRTPRFNISIK